MVICLGWSASLSAQEILTNSDIVQLVKLGMSDDLILAKIEGSSNDFDMSTSMLVALKQDGVSDQVMAAMMKAASDDTKKVVDLNDPLSPHRPGIYYKNDQGELVEMLPSAVSDTKQRGGFGKISFIYKLDGARSRTNVKRTPVFYFYFSTQDTEFKDPDVSGFGQVMSPQEFALVRLREKGDTRELVFSGPNIVSMSIDDDAKVTFEMEQLTNGVFKVTPDALPVGEYCFLHSGVTTYYWYMQRVFDFGVE
ncbi:MAG: hypothetical protein KDC02_06215 [Flavobacteriales bacterium]|nr:hypothetical protein [Flavobacteriales bacterium]